MCIFIIRRFKYRISEKATKMVNKPSMSPVRRNSFCRYFKVFLPSLMHQLCKEKKMSIVPNTEEQMTQRLILPLVSVHRENRQYQPH